jgi:hypothetical protein
VKFKSPEIIIPDNKIFRKEELIVRLKEMRSKLFTAAATLNLNEVVSHEILGAMTRLEILSFVLYHTQRHVHQLKRIREKITPLQQSV